MENLEYAVFNRTDGSGEEVVFIPKHKVCVFTGRITRLRSNGGHSYGTCFFKDNRVREWKLPIQYNILDILAVIYDRPKKFLQHFQLNNESYVLQNKTKYVYGKIFSPMTKSEYKGDYVVIQCVYFQDEKLLNEYNKNIEKSAIVADYYGFDFKEYNTLEIIKTNVAVNAFKVSSVKISKQMLESSDADKVIKNDSMVDKKDVKVATKIEKEENNIIKKEKKNNVDNSKNKDEKMEKLLNCDYNRCRLPRYEEQILTDIKMGHWDLFSNQEQSTKYVARDPHLDVKSQGVVGIDFGTKGTVVMRQDSTDDIIPLRIGSLDLSAQVNVDKDFENPTIIECTNLDSFIEAYNKSEGRPETSCEDVFVSYDAVNSFNSDKKYFYAYYSNLKQWSTNTKQSVKVVDKRAQQYDLAEKVEKGKTINPIELYAYYIGMCINNMRNGIYMKYLMSFPVGYSKETREFIRSSFEKGIKKSLPKEIVEDDKAMSSFKVELGVSEPAAYAVTALSMNKKFDATDENDQFMYGIFDFGGGTADFDFGIWRGASEEEYDNESVDYVLECFGADSDATLGGENILELLSYHVFKSNLDVVRDKKLVISLPEGEKAFLGSEMLLDSSMIAYRNMSNFKEALRPLWHQSDGWEKMYRLDEDEDSKKTDLFIQPTVYDRTGKQIPNCKFKIDSDELIGLIKTRIKKGVDLFFGCLMKTMRDKSLAKKANQKVYIMLAGNSSKSKFVQELFQNEIKEKQEMFKKVEPNLNNELFELVIVDNEVEADGTEYIPNSKTGVAYGLVKSRLGSSIKIVKNYQTDTKAETRFKYYLGRDRRKVFNCIISPVTTDYNSWVAFQGAVNPVVRLYYTTNPVADISAEKLSTNGIKYKELNITPMDGGKVFVRTVSPEEIEYAVAVNENDINDEIIVKCSLEE